MGRPLPDVCSRHREGIRELLLEGQVPLPRELRPEVATPRAHVARGHVQWRRIGKADLDITWPVEIVECVGFKEKWRVQRKPQVGSGPLEEAGNRIAGADYEFVPEHTGKQSRNPCN